MGNGGILQCNLSEILFRVLNALADGVGDFGSLSKTVADNAVAVAHYYEGRELEDTSALYGFGYAVDGNNPFAQAVPELRGIRVYSSQRCLPPS